MKKVSVVAGTATLVAADWTSCTNTAMVCKDGINYVNECLTDEKFSQKFKPDGCAAIDPLPSDNSGKCNGDTTNPAFCLVSQHASLKKCQLEQLVFSKKIDEKLDVIRGACATAGTPTDNKAADYANLKKRTDVIKKKKYVPNPCKDVTSFSPKCNSSGDKDATKKFAHECLAEMEFMEGGAKTDAEWNTEKAKYGACGTDACPDGSSSKTCEDFENIDVCVLSNKEPKTEKFCSLKQKCLVAKHDVLREKCENFMDKDGKNFNQQKAMGALLRQLHSDLETNKPSATSGGEEYCFGQNVMYYPDPRERRTMAGSDKPKVEDSSSSSSLRVLAEESKKVEKDGEKVKAKAPPTRTDAVDPAVLKNFDSFDKEKENLRSKEKQACFMDSSPVCVVKEKDGVKSYSQKENACASGANYDKVLTVTETSEEKIPEETLPGSCEMYDPKKLEKLKSPVDATADFKARTGFDDAKTKVEYTDKDGNKQYFYRGKYAFAVEVPMYFAGATSTSLPGNKKSDLESALQKSVIKMAKNAYVDLGYGTHDQFVSPAIDVELVSLSKTANTECKGDEMEKKFGKKEAKKLMTKGKEEGEKKAKEAIADKEKKAEDSKSSASRSLAAAPGTKKGVFAKFLVAIPYAPNATGEDKKDVEEHLKVIWRELSRNQEKEENAMKKKIVEKFEKKAEEEKEYMDMKKKEQIKKDPNAFKPLETGASLAEGSKAVGVKDAGDNRRPMAQQKPAPKDTEGDKGAKGTKPARPEGTTKPAKPEGTKPEGTKPKGTRPGTKAEGSKPGTKAEGSAGGKTKPSSGSKGTREGKRALKAIEEPSKPMDSNLLKEVGGELSDLLAIELVGLASRPTIPYVKFMPIADANAMILQTMFNPFLRKASDLKDMCRKKFAPGKNGAPTEMKDELVCVSIPPSHGLKKVAPKDAAKKAEFEKKEKEAKEKLQKDLKEKKEKFEKEVEDLKKSDDFTSNFSEKFVENKNLFMTKCQAIMKGFEEYIVSDMTCMERKTEFKFGRRKFKKLTNDPCDDGDMGVQCDTETGLSYKHSDCLKSNLEQDPNNSGLDAAALTKLVTDRAASGMCEEKKTKVHPSVREAVQDKEGKVLLSNRIKMNVGDAAVEGNQEQIALGIEKALSSTMVVSKKPADDATDEEKAAAKGKVEGTLKVVANTLFAEKDEITTARILRAAENVNAQKRLDRFLGRHLAEAEENLTLDPSATTVYEIEYIIETTTDVANSDVAASGRQDRQMLESNYNQNTLNVSLQSELTKAGVASNNAFIETMPQFETYDQDSLNEELLARETDEEIYQSIILDTLVLESEEKSAVQQDEVEDETEEDTSSAASVAMFFTAVTGLLFF